jgi:hypothetical protein
LTVHVPLNLSRRGGRKLIVSPDGAIALPYRQTRIDSTLVKALARAYRWQRLIENGTYTSIAEIAKAEHINDSYVSRLMRLTLLAPDIVEAIVDGRSSPAMTLDQMVKPHPAQWQAQRSVLG